jgi:hypothetical protein
MWLKNNDWVSCLIAGKNNYLYFFFFLVRSPGLKDDQVPSVYEVFLGNQVPSWHGALSGHCGRKETYARQ